MNIHELLINYLCCLSNTIIVSTVVPPRHDNVMLSNI